MVYNYLLDLYNILGERRKELEGQNDDSSSLDAKEYLRGQITAIDEFKQFLQDNYHDKLPRRKR